MKYRKNLVLFGVKSRDENTCSKVKEEVCAFSHSQETLTMKKNTTLPLGKIAHVICLDF